MTRSPTARRWWKRRLPDARHHQRHEEEDGHEQGEIGRSEGRIPVQPGVEAESEKENQDRNGEVSGNADEIAEGGSELGNMGHDAGGTSFAFTLVLVMPLAICVLGAGTAGWKHIAVAGGYWCALFGVSFWVLRRWGAGTKGPVRLLFVESRMAIALIGIAAVTFRSPVLLEVVPDILAVAIAASGCMDGMAVAESRRVKAAALSRASSRAVPEGRQ